MTCIACSAKESFEIADVEQMIENDEIEYFSAYVLDAEAEKNGKCLLTIDRVTLNENYEDASLTEETYILNDVEECEILEVAADVPFLPADQNSGKVGENLEIILAQDGSYFDFYTVEGEIVYVSEGVCP